MKAVYKHPAIPPEGIELGTKYEILIKGNKATVSLNEFKLELTKYQAETMFEEVKENSEQ